jgi:hypothetical protein
MKLQILTLILASFFLESCTSTRRVKTEDGKKLKGPESHTCDSTKGERWNGTTCKVVQDTEIDEAECKKLKRVWESDTCTDVALEPTAKAPCNMSDLKICLQYNKSKSLCYPKVGCDLKKDIPVYSCNNNALNQCIEFDGGENACHIKYDCAPSL